MQIKTGGDEVSPPKLRMAETQMNLLNNKVQGDMFDDHFQNPFGQPKNFNFDDQQTQNHKNQLKLDLENMFSNQNQSNKKNESGNPKTRNNVRKYFLQS